MLFWNRTGTVNHRELYDLSESPTEEGSDIASARSEDAEKLQTRLLEYLTAVGADKPKPGKRRR